MTRIYTKYNNQETQKKQSQQSQTDTIHNIHTLWQQNKNPACGNQQTKIHTLANTQQHTQMTHHEARILRHIETRQCGKTTYGIQRIHTKHKHRHNHE